jgi:cytochrome P450
MAEGVLLLAMMAQRFKLRLKPGHQVMPQALLTLRPRDGMPMRLERR